MKKGVIFILFALFVTCGYSQENKSNTATDKSLIIELNTGKLFSPYRFYKNHTGYENVWIGISKNITRKYGLQLAQSYGRLYSEMTNNLTMVFNTTVSHLFYFFPDKKINIIVGLGTGLTYIYTKCLYEEYPIKEHYTGVPVRLNVGAFYKLNDNLSVSLNLDSYYSWIFSYETHYLIINDPYYYKTFFFSLNAGIRYSFGKKEKK